MNSEFIVDVKPSEISIALLENKRLVEINHESRKAEFMVGDIYLGRVKKLMPGLMQLLLILVIKKTLFYIILI